jgi:hypothetical protein
MFPSIDVGEKVYFYDDFLGAALQGAVAGQNDTGGINAISAGVEGGVVGIETDSDSGDRVQLTMGLNHKPASGGLRFATRLRSTTDALTRAYFVGWTDTVAAENPIEISGTTITANATDAVGFVYDTATTDPDNWYFIGVKGGVVTALTKVQFDGKPIAPSTAWQNFVVDVTPDGHAVGSWGENTGTTAAARFGTREVARLSNAVTPSVLLTPIVHMENRSTTRRIAQVDYFLVTSARNGK